MTAARNRQDREERSIRASLETIHRWAKAHPAPNGRAMMCDVSDELPSSSAFGALLLTVQAARDAALVREACEDILASDLA